MDGRWFTVLFALLLPAALMGVTIVYFASNPVSIFALFAVMIAGGYYLLTYTEAFA